MKIIFVDDEIAAFRTLLPGLIDADLECKLFMDNPLAALDYVRNNDVAIAFLDICMPKVNGVELADQLLRERPDLKIVLISGYPQDESLLAAHFGDRLLGFCRKPFDRDSVLRCIRLATPGQRPKLFIRTFNGFDLFADGRAVYFPSSKSKELLALLVDANGSYVSLDTAVACLWEDKNAEHGKRLYRDAVCRLRLALSAAGLPSLVTFERAKAVLHKTGISCDYWDFLNGKGTFPGRYLPQYSWSVLTESFLQTLRQKD